MKQNEYRASVFGSTGFIGKWLCEESDFILEDVPSRHLAGDCPRLLYLRGTTHNYNFKDDPTYDIKVNEQHLMDVLETCRHTCGLEEVNFVSSWFVYTPNLPLPVSEDAPCEPTGFYSITKRAAEKLLIAYCDYYQIPWRILRLANVMGVGDNGISHKKNAVQYMIRELCLGNKVDYVYREDHTRDFIDVRDVVSAVDCVLDFGEPNQIYNIGSGIGYSVQDVLDYAAKKLHMEDQLAYIDAPAFHKQVQGQHMQLDISKLMGLGYESEYTILDTVDWLIDYYRNE